MAKRRPSGEFTLIAKYFAPLAQNYPLAFTLRDDAAILRPRRGSDIITTMDTFVEDVHFFRDDPPDLIARKLLRTNLSDLAAKGAKPVGYLLSTAWRRNISERHIARFAKGLAVDQKIFDISLIGGDTVSTNHQPGFTIAAFGLTPRGQMIRRDGARPGDDIYVTGTIGDAYLGLMLRAGKAKYSSLSSSERRYLLERFQLPEPRNLFGVRLRKWASAAADISDGLFADLHHICQASKVGAVLQLSDIPLSTPARRLWQRGKIGLSSLFNSGDDYELCFCAPPKTAKKLKAISKLLNLPVTKIGKITAGNDIFLTDSVGHQKKYIGSGYRHF